MSGSESLEKDCKLSTRDTSDYVIAQFRFLKRLLFVHGHWSYAQNGNMLVLFINPDLRDIYLVRILNFFYKNIVSCGGSGFIVPGV